MGRERGRAHRTWYRAIDRAWQPHACAVCPALSPHVQERFGRNDRSCCPGTRRAAVAPMKGEGPTDRVWLSRSPHSGLPLASAPRSTVRSRQLAPRSRRARSPTSSPSPPDGNITQSPASRTTIPRTIASGFIRVSSRSSSTMIATRLGVTEWTSWLPLKCDGIRTVAARLQKRTVRGTDAGRYLIPNVTSTALDTVAPKVFAAGSGTAAWKYRVRPSSAGSSGMSTM